MYTLSTTFTLHLKSQHFSQISNHCRVPSRQSTMHSKKFYKFVPKKKVWNVKNYLFFEMSKITDIFWQLKFYFSSRSNFSWQIYKTFYSVGVPHANFDRFWWWYYPIAGHRKMVWCNQMGTVWKLTLFKRL